MGKTGVSKPVPEFRRLLGGVHKTCMFVRKIAKCLYRQACIHYVGRGATYKKSRIATCLLSTCSNSSASKAHSILLEGILNTPAYLSNIPSVTLLVNSFVQLGWQRLLHLP